MTNEEIWRLQKILWVYQIFYWKKRIRKKKIWKNIENGNGKGDKKWKKDY